MRKRTTSTPKTVRGVPVADSHPLTVEERWHGPYPTSSPTAAPLIVARLTEGQCQPCPVRSQCTTSRESARNVGFPPRGLRDLQLHVRTEQQSPDWRARYAVRCGSFRSGGTPSTSSLTDTACAAATGGSRRHPLAVNIERLSGLSPTGEAPGAGRRPPSRTSRASTGSPG
ncbi:transposase [Streptomyces sp. NPDC005708]|uniref:transposase n=1 Tax=Streptomyces sp. NPDC005708 TaxID=3154564 RepID=UPI0033D7808A